MFSRELDRSQNFVACCTNSIPVEEKCVLTTLYTNCLLCIVIYLYELCGKMHRYELERWRRSCIVPAGKSGFPSSRGCG